MSSLKFIGLGFLVLTVSGCFMAQPFVDRRREAGAKTPETLYVGLSTPENPAICYNSWVTPYAKVKKMADEECRKQGTGTHAEPTKQSYFDCRLMMPNHVYFKCIK